MKKAIWLGLGAFILTGTSFAFQKIQNEMCFSKSRQHVCVEDHGHERGVFHVVERFSIGKEEPRKLIIYLPRSIADSNKEYPVVYFLDGQSIFFPYNFVGKSWQFAETVDRMADQIPEMIAVGIYPLQRNKEYTHDHVHFQACCGLETHADYIVNAIRPFIEEAYPVRTGREHTAIVGSSHGGLAAFYLGSRYPNIFGYVGSLSPSFWVGMFPVNWRYSLEKSPLVQGFHKDMQIPSHRPKLWLSWGKVRSGGPHNSFIERLATIRGREMVQLLTKKYHYKVGDQLNYFEDDHGEHDEDTWALHLPVLLQWMFR